jgi:hypothetical protein
MGITIKESYNQASKLHKDKLLLTHEILQIKLTKRMQNRNKKWTYITQLKKYKIMEKF